MKKNELAKLNSGHQKLLKAIWDQKRREMTEAKSSNPDRQTNQPVPTATAASTVKSNLK